jgi:hypothetical protein
MDSTKESAMIYRCKTKDEALELQRELGRVITAEESVLVEYPRFAGDDYYVTVGLAEDLDQDWDDLEDCNQIDGHAV